MPTVWAVFSFESTAFYISLYHANVVVRYKGLKRICQEVNFMEAWAGFKGETWKNEINVRDFSRYR